MSKYMTPEQARKYLERYADEEIPDRIAHRALETLAADTIECRVEHQHIDGGLWYPVTRWAPEWPLNEGHTVAPDERIVCRRVSPEWEVTNE